MAAPPRIASSRPRRRPRTRRGSRSVVNQLPTVSLTAPSSGLPRHGQHHDDPHGDGRRRRRHGEQGRVLRWRDAARRGRVIALQRQLDADSAGAHTLTARATDNDGGATTSAAVNVTVNPSANVPPTATLTAPATGATLAVQHAGDADGHGGRCRWVGDQGRVLRRRHAARRGHLVAVLVQLDADSGGPALAHARGDRQPERGGRLVGRDGDGEPPPNRLPSWRSRRRPTAHRCREQRRHDHRHCVRSRRHGQRGGFYDGATLLGDDTASPYSYQLDSDERRHAHAHRRRHRQPQRRRPPRPR